MTAEKLQTIINQGEGTRVEFKTASLDLNRDAFDSICGFLNRSGGHLILGVKDNGTIKGIEEDNVQKVVNVIVIADKKVILVYVPESSQVHATAGKVFDRNQDGDLNITAKSDLVSQLYLHKQNSYSENKVYPFVKITDFKTSLFVPLKKTSEKTSEKKLIEGIAKSSDKIIKLMHFNKFITIAELAEQIEISERSIERNIAKLQLENRVERKGSDRSGYWQVIDE